MANTKNKGKVNKKMVKRNNVAWKWMKNRNGKMTKKEKKKKVETDTELIQKVALKIAY